MVLLLFEHPTERIIYEAQAVCDLVRNAGDKNRDSDRKMETSLKHSPGPTRRNVHSRKPVGDLRVSGG
jgi:hypothetical protein